MRPRVKICGVRRVADAQLAVELGATHIGCVLAVDSPRCATLEEARELAAALAGTAQMILVFRNPQAQDVAEVSTATGIANVQVHGVDEEFYASLETRGLIVHRVHSLSPGTTELPHLQPVPTEECPSFLDVGRGGAGQAFDWNILRGRVPHATFIAGGVTPDNVSALVGHQPWGVDLSSGVESAPGVKDPEKLKHLFAVVAEVEA